MKNDKKIRIAFAIDWETDEGNADFLPGKVAIPESVADDDIADYLSDEYGFLVRAYSVEKVDLPFNMSLPFPWAVFEISDEELERVEKMEEEGTVSIKKEFFNSVMDDTDDEFLHLLSDYRRADAKTRSAIDATLVRVCGWSLPTLCKMAEEEAGCSEGSEE